MRYKQWHLLRCLEVFLAQACLVIDAPMRRPIGSRSQRCLLGAKESSSNDASLDSWDVRRRKLAWAQLGEAPMISLSLPSRPVEFYPLQTAPLGLCGTRISALACSFFNFPPLHLLNQNCTQPYEMHFCVALSFIKVHESLVTLLWRRFGSHSIIIY
jgi:hypothetical protein